MDQAQTYQTQHQEKLEIQEDIRIKFGKISQDLYPETKIILNALLCQWTRENYSEMIQLLHKDAFTEYECSLGLSEIFYDKFISATATAADVSSSLIEFIVNSGIIENYRVSIYLYCCDALILNIDDAQGRFDVMNDRVMARYLLMSYYNTDEIMVNEFIEIRDSTVLK